MNVSDYLTETITRKRVTGRDVHDQPTTSSSSIRARVQRVSTVIALPDGTQYASDAKVFTVDDLELGDVVVIDSRDRTVVRLDVLKALDGAFSHREAYV